MINVEMRCYQESVLAGLLEDGYTVINASDADDDQSGAVIQSVKAASEQLYTAECEAIASSDDLSPTELKKLQDKRAKTQAERHQQRFAELSYVERLGSRENRESVYKGMALRKALSYV